MADIEASDKLTPAQYRAVSALLTEATIRKAAEVAGVKERTVYNWLKVPAFADEYRAARREATQQAIARVQLYSSNAAATLVMLMATGNPAAVRLAAASKILDLAIKSVEIDDLAARLEALEARYAEKL
jgi:RES domain-containing protein